VHHDLTVAKDLSSERVQPTTMEVRFSGYHGRFVESKDMNTGLLDPIIITARGSSRADGTPHPSVSGEFQNLRPVVMQIEGLRFRSSWQLKHRVIRFMW
jgi:hypothetical protein